MPLDVQARARPAIVRQPLGVVLIIAPWNYPVQLCSRRWSRRSRPATPPCSSRPSWRPATSAALADLVPRVPRRPRRSPSSRAASTRPPRCSPSASTTSSTPATARSAASSCAAAAEHLTPVTLELGGKSPAIVAADADLEVAARRIAWGKFVNAGQTCVAPDYVLVDRVVEDQLLGGVLRAVHDFYGDDPGASADYGRIVNERHFDRLTGLLDAGGYEAVVIGGDRRPRPRGTSPPTVLAGVKPDAAVMQRGDLRADPAGARRRRRRRGDRVRQRPRPKPLALYVFTQRRRRRRAGRSSARRRAA